MSLPEVKLREWEEATPDRCPNLAGRRLPLHGPDSQTAEMLSRSGRLEILELARGLELRATSWVGRLTLAGLSISIWPKINALPLLTLMRYAYGLRNLR